jgi:hypothetical protein
MRPEIKAESDSDPGTVMKYSAPKYVRLVGLQPSVEANGPPVTEPIDGNALPCVAYHFEYTGV